MADWITWWTQALWRNGLSVVPMALIVWAIVRWGVHRPATRHALWLGALIWLVAAVLLPPMAARDVGESAAGEAAISESTPDRPIDACPPNTEPTLAMLEPEASAALQGDCEDWSALSHVSEASAFSFEASSDADVTDVPVEKTACADSRGINEFEFEPTIDLIESSDIQDPTPPTTVVRPDGHAPPHQIAAHDSVGQSSPLNACIDRAPEKLEPVSISSVSNDSESIPLECRAIASGAGEAETRAPVPAGRERIGIVGIPPRAPGDSSPRLAPSIAETFGSNIRQWFGAWLRLRDSIGAMPTMPPVIWLGVAILLIGIKAIACVRFHIRMRSARPAPHGVRAMVESCAQSIGLKTPPMTVFLADRVSPMVVCGWRPRLVLPVALWSELDPAGRRAVIVHELAHLRRRDHLTHWFDCLIGVVYWWHPVVWWVRQRLRDEAENACDAWVTWIDPRERRAYATALLQARTFLSQQGRFSPVPAVGVMSPQATRFSRRLTMVMTSRVSPKAFSMGMFAIPVLFLAAWISMPASTAACPPKDGDDAEPVKLIRINPQDDADDAGVSIVAENGVQRIVSDQISLSDPATGRLIKVQPSISHDGVVLTVGADEVMEVGWDAMAGDVDVHPAHDADERLARLERQMAELSEKLSVLIEQRMAPAAAARAPMTGPRTAVRAAPTPLAAGGGRARTAPSAFATVPMLNGVVIRTYQLPGAKLKALTKLMSRADVPTRVRSVPGGIEVHASEANQAKFAAFVEMISGEGMDDTHSYRLPKGKLEDLTNLMALDDVPVLVHPGDDEIGVQGGGLIQKTFRDFLDLLGPESASDSGLRLGTTAAMAPRAALERGKLAGALRQYETAARTAPDAARVMETKRRVSANRLRAAKLQAEAARLEAEADRLSDQAEQMREKAEQMKAKMDSAKSDEDRATLDAAAAELQVAAAQIERQLEDFYRQAEELESRADAMEEVAEASDE